MLKIFFSILVILSIFITPLVSEEIVIGGIFARSGPASFLGRPADMTAVMMIEEINSKGGINGKKIRMISRDSRGNPDAAMNKVIFFSFCFTI